MVEARTDFTLRRAKNFDIRPPEFIQFRADCSCREFGRIAIPAEMSEDHPGDLSGQDLRDHRGRGGVREMAVARLDPLFHRPGPMRIVLQKFFVVIRFNHQGLHLAQTLDRQARGMPEVGHVAERASRPREKCNRLVRPHRAERKTFHRDVADGKARTSAKNSPMAMFP